MEISLQGMNQTYLVRVTTRSAKNEVVAIDQDHLKVKIKKAPVKGAANAELIKVLADYFKVSQSQVEILKGQRSKNKIVRIDFG